MQADFSLRGSPNAGRLEEETASRLDGQGGRAYWGLNKQRLCRCLQAECTVCTAQKPLVHHTDNLSRLLFAIPVQSLAHKNPKIWVTASLFTL